MKEKKEIKFEKKKDIWGVKDETIKPETPLVQKSYGVVNGPSIAASKILNAKDENEFCDFYVNASLSLKEEVAKELGVHPGVSRATLKGRFKTYNK